MYPAGLCVSRARSRGAKPGPTRLALARSWLSRIGVSKAWTAVVTEVRNRAHKPAIVTVAIVAALVSGVEGAETVNATGRPENWTLRLPRLRRESLHYL